MRVLLSVGSEPTPPAYADRGAPFYNALTDKIEKGCGSPFRRAQAVDFGVDFSPFESHALSCVHIETKFLWLFRAVELATSWMAGRCAGWAAGINAG